MTPTDIATKYERQTIQLLLCENAMEMAIAWLNTGEIAKAQDILQGALLDAQLSHLKLHDFQKSNATH